MEIVLVLTESATLLRTPSRIRHDIMSKTVSRQYSRRRRQRHFPRRPRLSKIKLLNKTTVCLIIHSNEGIGMKVVKIAELAKEPQKSPLFTGPVTMQTIVGTELSKHFMIRQVNFARGVRNKFHSHSIEQVLIVTEGRGIVATEKEEKVVVPGDVVFVAAGEKHWHGAAEGATFSHIYIMSPDQNTTQLEP